MRLSDEVVTYYKAMANDAGVSYQSLVNLYLYNCVMHHRQIEIACPTKA